MAKSAHVQQYKKDEVKHFVQLIDTYPIVAVVNMEGLPTPQLQNMRGGLRGQVEICMTKKRLLKLAIEQASKKHPGLEALLPHLKGMPALLFSKESPFKLYKTLQKSKSSAPAKAGQKAPRDIVVPAGPTPFAPGPVIGELSAVGIKAGVVEGKVAIREPSTIAHEGDVISPAVASMLIRLSIMPMEVGLDLVAAFEKGTVYDRSILGVDESQYINDITTAHRQAFNLAVEAGVLNTATTEVLLGKADRQARGLAIQAGILASGVTESIIAKAENEAKYLNTLIN